jgi:hypothetical protein
MDHRGVKEGNIAMVLRHQQRDLGAAQDDALGSFADKVADNPPIGIPGCRVDDPRPRFSANLWIVLVQITRPMVFI